MGKTWYIKPIIVCTISFVILITGSIPVVTSIKQRDLGPANTHDQVQRIYIFGMIENYDNSSFNVIFFYGKIGFYISKGWKGVYLGRIRDVSFRIYESSFQGIINEDFILGTGIQQSGPFSQ